MKNHVENFRLVLALIVLPGLFPATLAMAQSTFKTLHSFNYSDGASPYSALVLSGNTLYGTASAGGNSGSYNGNGTLFAINTDGSGFTNEYVFTAYPPGYYYTNSDGSVPFAGLILSGNTLYGAAYDGGALGAGTVFAVNTSGAGFTNLYTFSGGTDGGGPDAALILSSNVLYGTTAYGGGANNGTVFAINLNGTGFTNLFSFTNGISGGDPAGSLILSGRTLYGTTSGGNGGFGTVFAISTDGTHFTNLYSFTANSGFPAYTNRDGSNPNAGLVLAGPTLYGTAPSGGRFGSGTLFAVNTNGTGFTNLYSFTATSGSPATNSDGANPRGSLLLSGGTLIGTAYNGGAFGSGTVFAINTNGAGFTTLHTFTASGLAPYTNSDGAHPNAALILSGNMLYGTAYGGGDDPINNMPYGTVFNLSLGAVSEPSLTITLSGTNVILTWSATGFTLQSTTNLESPQWTLVSGQNTVTNPIVGSQKFFRLNQ